MKILHGTWIPQGEDDFIQNGGFYLWVETSDPPPKSRKRQPVSPESATRTTPGTPSANRHPGQLTRDEFSAFLVDDLGIAKSPDLSEQISPKYFILPSTEGAPLPSVELIRYLEVEPEEPSQWQAWEIDCYQVKAVIKALSDLYFLALHNSSEIGLGADLLFWYHYTQSFKQVILKDQYIPAFKYRELPATKGKGKKKPPAWEIYTGWEIISEQYESQIAAYIDYMPLACVSGKASPEREFYDRPTLLRHFSECLLQNIVVNTPWTAAFDKKISGSQLLSRSIHCPVSQQNSPEVLAEYQQWQGWKEKLIGAQTAAAFHLVFQLESPQSENVDDDWQIKFLASLKKDPSLKLDLVDYWHLAPAAKKAMQKQFGRDFEKDLLLNLGYAARMYPKIWTGLETDRPVGFLLTITEAFAFLKESAWVLEDAGYKVMVPAWWTPAGRQRAKIRLRASSSKKAVSSAGKGYFNLQTIVQYEYELAIGGQAVSAEEWQQLVNVKTPLVKFRGQWMELDQNQMQQMLDFWATHSEEQPEMTLLDLWKKTAEDMKEWELEPDATLGEMMAGLHDPSKLEPIANPPQLQGTLREYQKRGVSWIQYLEQLGLNGCLADDMGLGKSLQVIGRLVTERDLENTGDRIPPTLLIAPTSVVGNWQKEIEKFAPHLQSMIHHGRNRIEDETIFQAASLKQDIVITTFTLARKDIKLLQKVTWQRIVLDEAHNIKNHKTAQTQAILKLTAHHRLALTGTPVENRPLDLWSIFNFLNPGYLGKEAQFRKNFEQPIQKENNKIQARVLKKLVEPFILRRVKTDKQIIKDLPDKVELKQYCNLTQEQASLYEAVVKDVEKQLQEVEGIQRKELTISTLIKLKQICNHPRQYLQDGSEFSPDRSHKFARLGEMTEEVISEGESLLIFTQFTEIGEALQKYLKLTMRYNTYYLHGGTSRTKREQMIAEFQDPETDPTAFILSLKAGGVGITLTKANHVFHFDRWWNPAVEDQATDRAFRIGQEKNVFVHKFVTLGTLEERIDQMIEDKKKVASAIVGSDESWLTELDNESFKQLIALNRQAIL